MNDLTRGIEIDIHWGPMTQGAPLSKWVNLKKFMKLDCPTSCLRELVNRLPTLLGKG